MKLIWKICVLVLWVSLLSACGGGGGGSSQVSVGKGRVDFVVSAASEKARPAGLSAMSSETPGNMRPQAAVISSSVNNVRVVVKRTATGVSAVYVLPLSAFGVSYKADPVSLEVGAYTLEEFEVRDVASRVLYASPKQNSLAASAVDVGEALPKAITVTLAGAIIAPQIVSTENQTPANFGFASFSLELKESITFQIGAFTWDGTTATRVAADVAVTADGAQIFTGTIANPSVASITIKESASPNAVYAVTVSKSAYTSYTTSPGLSAAQLKRRINGNDGGDGIIDARLVPTP